MATKNSIPEFNEIEGMDPAADWLLGPAIHDFLPDPESTAIPFLLELSDDGAVEAFRALPPFDGEAGDGALVLGFGPEDTRIREGALLPVLAPLEWFRRLLFGEGPFERFRAAKKRILLSTPLDASKGRGSKFPKFPKSGAARGASLAPPKGGWPEGTVFTAVIDDGIAFAHDRLRMGPAETRVQAFWNMNGLIDRPPVGPTPPLGLPGEILKDWIDARLAGPWPGGEIDEDQVYAAAGLIDHRDGRHKAAAWRRSHGAHVLDLAAGHDQELAVGNRPVIAVQLPTWVVAQTNGQRLDFYIWLAILYILDRADALAGKGAVAKLVINSSFGYIAAPHDGKAPLDLFMNRVIEERASMTQIILPAGNANLSRCHAVIDFEDTETVAVDPAGDTTVAFDFIVQPDDRTDSTVEVWLPEAGSIDNRMTMKITLPDGGSYSIEEAPGQKVDLVTEAGALAGSVLLATVDGQRMFHMSIAPTERPQPHDDPLAPAGRWRLEFTEGATEMAGPAHAWVQRDDSLYGYPQRGRQSYFDHADYVRYDEAGHPVTDDEQPAQAASPCPVTRKSLFNAIATGRRVITAGAFFEREGEVAPYSSGGPNTPPEYPPPPERRKPDALLPSDGSKPHYGVLAAGSRSGGRVAMNGTSVAAPELARHIVELLAEGKPADRDAVPDYVTTAGSAVTPQDPPDRSGWGRLARLDPLSVRRFDPGP